MPARKEHEMEGKAKLLQSGALRLETRSGCSSVRRSSARSGEVSLAGRIARNFGFGKATAASVMSGMLFIGAITCERT